MHTCIHTYIHTPIYTHTHSQACLRAHKNTTVYPSIYIYTHTLINMCAHISNYLYLHDICTYVNKEIRDGGAKGLIRFRFKGSR